MRAITLFTVFLWRVTYGSLVYDHHFLIIAFHIQLCFFITPGDRYDPEPRGTDQFDEFNGKTTQKSKIRELRERAGSYGEYKDEER